MEIEVVVREGGATDWQIAIDLRNILLGKDSEYDRTIYLPSRASAEVFRDALSEFLATNK